METINWLLTSGCTNLGDGCESCPSLLEYQEKGWDYSLKLHPELLDMPFRIEKSTIFTVCLGSDLFHEDVPDKFLLQAFNVMVQTPEHRYEICTKRAERMAQFLEGKNIPDHIYLGVTVERATHKWRVFWLQQIEAKNKSISFLPLLDDVGPLGMEGITHVTASRETWGLQRDFDQQWIDNIYTQCVEQGVHFDTAYNMYGVS